MREVFLKNEEILNRLNGFSNTFNSLNINDLDIKERNIGDQVPPEKLNKHYATSKDYLQIILKKVSEDRHEGPPEIIKGIDLGQLYGTPIYGPWREFADDVAINFARELGVQQNALCCFLCNVDFNEILFEIHIEYHQHSQDFLEDQAFF